MSQPFVNKIQISFTTTNLLIYNLKNLFEKLSKHTKNPLPHWGRVMHIHVYLSTLTIIGSEYGLSPGQCWNIVNTLRPRQNGRRFPDDIFKCIFMNENVWILIKISVKFVPKGPINDIPSLVQIMAWRRSGDKPLSEPMMVSLLTHICVTRRQQTRCLPLTTHVGVATILIVTS